MASLEEIRIERLKKLAILREKGIDPYPAKTLVDMTVREAIDSFGELEKNGKTIVLAGRILAIRLQGEIAFIDLYDGTARFQVLLKSDVIGKDSLQLFADTIDIGDFIEAEGEVFTSKRGEKTLAATRWSILSKSLRPLPEKWHGLQDIEERLRRRYLDILLNPEVRDMVEKRSQFWSAIRGFLLERGFVEVETPVLENTTGGAEARPFSTHHNALDMEVFLRISPELWLKRLIAAGLPRVFEIGRVFRNEGMDAEHLQDYTALEFYQAYYDYEEGMEMVTELFRHIADTVFGTRKFSIRGFEVDFDKEWEIYDYTEIIKENTGIDIRTAKLEEMEEKLQTLGVAYDKNGFNIARATDNLWKYCRKSLAGPGFLVGVPVTMEPLAKRVANDQDLVQRFQPIIAGSELGKGFSELNDPVDQAGRFAEQAKLRAAGDEEAQMTDEDFVETMEYGMPPIFGFGFSERVFSFLMDKPMRETQIFPLMRPKKYGPPGQAL